MAKGNQFGFVCPQCLRGNRLSVVGMKWFNLVPDGTEPDPKDNDVEWGGGSAARCKCGWTGTVLQMEDPKVLKGFIEDASEAAYAIEADKEDQAEQQRRDEKHGLYPDREDPAN